MRERVVITGIGMVTPVGNTAKDSWDAVLSGKHGFDFIKAFDTAEYKAKIAGEAKNFNPEDYMDKKEARRSDRFCHFAMAAARDAVRDSGIDFAAGDPYRVATIVGSGVGGFLTFETEHTKLMQKGPGRVSPFMVPMMITNMAAGMLSMEYGLRGPSYCPVSACASSAHALGEAFRLIKHGYADVAMAGGAEATITPLAIAGFINMTALSQSDDPDAASLPFDARRNGFVMGEGAGILILESLSHAQKRGAKIYAEIAGYGATSDAYHITSPDPEGAGAAAAMAAAVREAGIDPAEVGYINAHGTGTPYNDKFETTAIKACFGEHASKLAVSSTKSMTGHLLGAAGAVEAGFTALALLEGVLPPTVNLKEPDPECDLDYIPEGARKTQVQAALSNSLGFGGHNASLLLKRV